MFGIVIKNTVLFLLIILILHFMINNLLVEMNINNLNNKSVKVNGFGVKNNGKVNNNTNKNLLNKVSNTNNVNNNKHYIELQRAKPERLGSNDCSQNLQDIKMKELYDYVYSKDDESNLNKFYDINNNIIESSNNKDVEVKCIGNTRDNVNEYCNTSMPIKQELRKHYSNFREVSTDGKELSPLNNNNVSSLQFLDGQKDDNKNVIDGVGAFDSFDSNYDNL
tara:strand:+ start:471 stop:1136 length:666 start_codon:yes stop_codon:yes gene_type:complete